MTTDSQLGEHLSERERKVPVFSLEDEAKIEIIKTLRQAEPMGWGATPLNPYLPHVQAQQQDVEPYMDALFTEDLPEDVPPELAEAIHYRYMSRREHRRIRNFESFKHRGVQDLQSGPVELVEMADRAIYGRAHPAEIHLVGKYYEIPTRGLADVSVAYGKRIDDNNGLKGLREAVNECVVVHGGEFLDSKPVYQVQGFEMTDFKTPKGHEYIPRLKMTRSFDRAIIDGNCLILERSSFDLSLNKLFSLNPALAAQLLSMYQSGKPVAEADVLDIPEFRSTITELLDNDRFDVARPISVTAFEVDVELCEKYLDNADFRKAISLRRRLKNGDGDSSHLRAMIDKELDAAEAAEQDTEN